MKELWSRSKVPFVTWKAQNSKTDADLANVCGVHPMTINKWINGRSAVPFAWAKLLAETVGKTIDFLFEERAVRAPQPRRVREVDAALATVHGHPPASAAARTA